MKNFAKYLTTPAYAEIFEEILLPLKFEDLHNMKKVCPKWNDFINSSPKLCKTIIKKIRQKWLLIHPEMKKIMEEIEKNSEICRFTQILLEFDKEEQNHVMGQLNENGFFQLIFGNLERLKFFWPFMDFENLLNQVGNPLHTNSYFYFKHHLVYYVDTIKALDVIEFLKQNSSDFHELHNAGQESIWYFGNGYNR